MRKGFLMLMLCLAALANVPVMAQDYDVSVRTFDLASQDPGPGYECIIRLEGKKPQVVEGRTLGYPEDILKVFGNVWQADGSIRQVGKTWTSK